MLDMRGSHPRTSGVMPRRWATGHGRPRVTRRIIHIIPRQETRYQFGTKCANNRDAIKRHAHKKERSGSDKKGNPASLLLGVFKPGTRSPKGAVVLLRSVLCSAYRLNLNVRYRMALSKADGLWPIAWLLSQGLGLDTSHPWHIPEAASWVTGLAVDGSSLRCDAAHLRYPYLERTSTIR